MMPLVMMNVQAPALARLLPRPGAMPLSTSEKMPKMGISQISPSRKANSPWPFQLRMSAVFALVTTQRSIQSAIKVVGLEEHIPHKRLQERVGRGHGELIVRLILGAEVEVRGPGGLATIEIDPDVA